MHIVFVYPRFEKFLSGNPDLDKTLVDYFLADFTTPPSLGIPILASWTPPEHDMTFIDDNSGDPVDFSIRADIVAINCFTPQATRAFAIADGFRAVGTKVIMGGIFPTFMVDECLKHVDSVNVGEGETTWQTILLDVQAGALKPVYKGGNSFDLSKMRIPQRGIFYHKKSYDWDEDLVQVSRGCSYTCGMCALPAQMGGRIRFRPVEQVVEEIKQLKYENVYLADDSLFFQHRKLSEYANLLLKALIPLNKKYFVSSTMALNTDDAFLDLMAQAGVKNFYCTMNVDPVSIKALQGGVREQEMLKVLVTKLRERDIRFFASCGIGRDWDNESISEKVLNLFDMADIHTAEFFMFTPYPGSVFWDRILSQGRLIDREWSHYNGTRLVFKPLNMSPEKMYDQFITIWKEFFRRQKQQHTAHLEPATWQEGVRVVGKPLQERGVRGQAVVTGMGIISPIGCTPAAVTQALENGQTGITPITAFDTSHFRTQLGGQVHSFDPAEALNTQEIEEYDDRYLHFAITAARKALGDAGLVIGNNVDGKSIALVLGTCNGGLRTAEDEYKWLAGKSDKPFSEKMNVTSQMYGFGKAVSQTLGISGETWVVTTACSSTTGAIGLAHMLITSRLFKTVIVGGSDSLCIANMSGFNSLKATAQGFTAPFSLPPGMNVGEASVFWVVEELEQALLRKAVCYGKICGHATTCDAYHPTSPDPRGDGVFRTLRNALADAHVPLADIGCVNAHGTGTEANDRAESKGIARFSGDLSIPVTSTKSFVGHCMGTAGILEASANLLAMNNGFIPPTLNFSGPRPGCTLDYVPNNARKSEYKAFVSANYAFGGNNAAVVMSSWDFPVPKKGPVCEKIVITGAGVVCSLGITLEQTLEKLRSGSCGISKITRYPVVQAHAQQAGMVADFRATDVDRRTNFSGMNPISRYATTASWKAFENAGLKIGQKNAEQIGIAMGLCNGGNESDHMMSVFTSNDYQADVSSFSNIVANSIAGWVANALMLKGVNTTLSSGPHAGLQSIAYAALALQQGRAEALCACAADEVYPRTFYNYEMLNRLYVQGEEHMFGPDSQSQKKTILGEGAAALILETAEAATKRGALVLAEVCGYGMSMDIDYFTDMNLSTTGLSQAFDSALLRSGISEAEIDIIVWAPQGNLQDEKVRGLLGQKFGMRFSTIPYVTTTYNTGFIEASSILVDCACLFAALKNGLDIWPQHGNNGQLEKCSLKAPPRYILACASTGLGYNYVVVFKNGISL